MLQSFIISSMMVGSIFIIIGVFALHFWLKKQNIKPNPYFSILIMIILILVYIIMGYVLDFPYDLIGMYIVSTLIAAFLIRFLYKIDTLSSLRFTSWFIFLISIGWILALFFLIPLVAAIILIF